MRVDGFRLLVVVLLVLGVVVASDGASNAAAETLALIGGTVIDTADWGRSEADLEDAVVIIQDGEITAVAVAIPFSMQILARRSTAWIRLAPRGRRWRSTWQPRTGLPKLV